MSSYCSFSLHFSDDFLEFISFFSQDLKEKKNTAQFVSALYIDFHTKPGQSFSVQLLEQPFEGGQKRLV